MTAEEYRHFLFEDGKALGMYAHNSCWPPLSPFLIDKEIGRFQYLLRTCEYLFNKNSKMPWQILRKWWYARAFKKQSLRLGFTIPCGVFGAGLRIAHRGTIVVNANARVGKNCTINAGVNIGTKAGFADKCPHIGDNVYIGPGAKIFGDIKIADGCAIGANAVVTHDIMQPNSIVAGVPATIIGEVKRNMHV